MIEVKCAQRAVFVLIQSYIIRRKVNRDWRIIPKTFIHGFDDERFNETTRKALDRNGFGEAALF